LEVIGAKIKGTGKVPEIKQPKKCVVAVGVE
jgi:hypothetical protein